MSCFKTCFSNFDSKYAKWNAGVWGKPYQARALVLYLNPSRAAPFCFGGKLLRSSVGLFMESKKRYLTPSRESISESISRIESRDKQSTG